jgi:hypothetical protein
MYMVRHQHVTVDDEIVTPPVSLDAREIRFTVSVIRKDAPSLIASRNHMVEASGGVSRPSAARLRGE